MILPKLIALTLQEETWELPSGKEVTLPMNTESLLDPESDALWDLDILRYKEKTL